MSAIIKNYQKHADECARLAKESDDPKLRECFSKCPTSGRRRFNGRLMTRGARIDAALTRAFRRLECPRRDSAEATSAIWWILATHLAARA